MIYVGIDVAKDKHDCFITNSDGEVLFKPFTISNNREGFETLFERISSVSDDLNKVKVGLEATGHYSYNLLGFLLDKGLPTYIINPLHTNLYRKSLSLRKTKTDKVDSRTIATMMMSDMNSLKSYSNTSYHNEELKSLTRYHFDKVKERTKLKSSVSRLVSILFPELEKLVPTLHMASIYALFFEFHGKWDDSLLTDTLKHSVIEIIYSEAKCTGKPIFCIGDDAMDYGYQAVVVVLSYNGIVLNYAFVL